MRRIRLSWIIFVALLLLIESKMGPKRGKKQKDSLLSRLNGFLSQDGPVKVDVIENSYDKNLHLRCVANITNSVRFWWNFNNVTLQENERVLIQTKGQSSDLKIRKAQKLDSGIYECVARLSNGTHWAPLVSVDVEPPLKIKIRPKDTRLTTETGTFEWHCDNSEGSLVNATYSWFRKLLPVAPWRKIDNNEERFRWKIPSRLHAEKDGYDVYDMYCEITYRGMTVRGPLARILVTKPDADLGSCPAEISEGIRWNETLFGLVDAQLCLEGDENSGVAKRVCEAFPGRPPRWKAPNLKDCSSPAFAALEDQLDALDEGFKVNLDIKQALNELRSLTSPKKPPRPGVRGSARLFGKDLLATVDILKRTKSFFQKEKGNKTLATETLSSYTETASNVLDLENQETWLEIEESNPETPADLVTSLDNFGFDLEKDFAGDGDIIQNRVERNLAFQMRRIQRKKDFIFEQNKSRIFLPQTVFNQTTNEAVTVVSVIYNTLASILGDVNTTSGNLSSYFQLLSNSRIISSTVKPFGVSKFKRPVRIVLENNGASNDKYDQRRCVFWQPEEANSQWSDEGCRLVTNETTKDVTTCECDHLTLFAVMVESSEGDVDAEEQAKLELISTVGSAISLAAIILTMIIYVYYWKALWSPRFVNFMNLCAAIALLDIFSVLRGPFKHDEGPCTAIGILLHFFVLALFMWMLCEGVLLCLLLTNIFKKNYGRRWYFLVHLVGWGLPALIVVISVSIRGASFYGLAGHCWLSRSKGFIWAAIGPMILVLLASYAVYCVMLRRVITSHKVQQEDTLGKVKATARASIIIMPVLGFAWTFAILDFFFDEVAFKYLFAIFNSLQGLFIFIFHCVMNQQVQQAMFKNSKPAERKGILDRVKTQEMQMTGSQDSLETIK